MRVNGGQRISQPSQVIQIQASLASAFRLCQQVCNAISNCARIRLPPLFIEPAGYSMCAGLPQLLVIQFVAASEASAETDPVYSIHTTPAREMHQSAGT